MCSISKYLSTLLIPWPSAQEIPRGIYFSFLVLCCHAGLNAANANQDQPAAGKTTASKPANSVPSQFNKPIQEKTDSDKMAFFESKIRPILIKHCYECHSASAEEIAGNLVLDSKAGWTLGGDSGPAIVPGKSSDSLLLSAIEYNDLEMPPSGKLPQEVRDNIKRWIHDGAIDPRTGGTTVTKPRIDLEHARKSWRFQPLGDPSPPNKGLDFVEQFPSSIDRFIGARLVQKNIQPSNQAAPTELLERVYFDLIGLPPDPQTINEFQTGKISYEQLVDQLLESRHFGERFGRHWLDVARYADSSGGGRILLFPDAWRYRDYVVNSFHSDLPFDQFLKEQIAGDLFLPSDSEEILRKQARVTATGFLMLGPHNYELQDKELLRMEVVDEQINAVSRVFLGLTVSCARCHDHKFDPIPTEDYYALAGIFRSTKSLLPGNVSKFTTTPLPLEPGKQKVLDRYLADTAATKETIARLKQKLSLNKNRKQSFVASDLDSFPGAIADDQTARRVGQWSYSTSIKPFIGKGYHFSKNEGDHVVYRLVAQTSGSFVVRASQVPNPNRSTAALYRVTTNGKTSSHLVNQQLPPPLEGHFHILTKLKLNKGDVVTVRLESGPNGVTIADSIHLVSNLKTLPKKPGDLNQKENLQPTQQAIQRRQWAAELTKANTRLAELEKHKPASPANVMTVREEDKPGDFHVCIRGDVHSPGQAVKRGALRVIENLIQLEEPVGSGRYQLADWMASERNPLTARVYVNRVWGWVFGRGIVSTTNNFGEMGDSPSHPELLDFLATNFIRNGWSTKKLIRKIVLSKAYQRSSTAHKTSVEKDPANRLLGHFPLKRLDAEAIRDRILSFSGKLDDTFGGPAIKPNTKSEFGYVYHSNRRSIYLPVFRNTLNNLFEVFDFPNPNLVAGQRSTSTLPTQALYMLNSEFVRRQSKAAAERVIAHSPANLEQQLEFVYQIGLSRGPNNNEIEVARKFFQGNSDNRELPNPARQLRQWQIFCQIMISSIDFQYLK